MIYTLQFVSSAKLVGSGLATIGVAGSAVGIGLIFAALLLHEKISLDVRQQSCPR